MDFPGSVRGPLVGCSHPSREHSMPARSASTCFTARVKSSVTAFDPRSRSKMPSKQNTSRCCRSQCLYNAHTSLRTPSHHRRCKASALGNHYRIAGRSHSPLRTWRMPSSSPFYASTPNALARVELLSDNPPERLLERLTLPVHMLSQSGIDQSLVITATGCMHLALEPFDEVIVQADGDTSLSRWNRNYRTPLGSAEGVFFSHRFFS